MHSIRKMVLVAFAAVVVMLSAGKAIAAEKDSGERFAAYNIWYEKPNKVPSVNYHRGVIIPIGAKVSNVRASGDRVKFSFQGGEFAIEFTQRFHPTLNINTFRDQVFSTEDPATKIAELSEEEQAWVKAGVVQPKMSKAAVLLCWGPPPQHVTPSLSAPVWTYWSSRFGKTIVVFDADGKNVASVQ